MSATVTTTSPYFNILTFLDPTPPIGLNPPTFPTSPTLLAHVLLSHIPLTPPPSTPHPQHHIQPPSLACSPNLTDLSQTYHNPIFVYKMEIS